jgi:hypothetical protein
MDLGLVGASSNDGSQTSGRRSGRELLATAALHGPIQGGQRGEHTHSATERDSAALKNFGPTRSRQLRPPCGDHRYQGSRDHHKTNYEQSKSPCVAHLTHLADWNRCSPTAISRFRRFSKTIRTYRDIPSSERARLTVALMCSRRVELAWQVNLLYSERRGRMGVLRAVCAGQSSNRSLCRKLMPRKSREDRGRPPRPDVRVRASGEAPTMRCLGPAPAARLRSPPRRSCSADSRAACHRGASSSSNSPKCARDAGQGRMATGRTGPGELHNSSNPYGRSHVSGQWHSTLDRLLSCA